ncbi:MAG TPA: hypothetical protein GYA10_15680 [Alphaproteobacteria bacterium]|nr:hypothetical protein [Alphaproteobacteria bacterium]
MTSLRFGLIGALIVSFALGAAPAIAQQQVQNLGTFKNWTAWKGTDANGEMCYISSQPQTTKPEGVKRSPIHFLVIHRKGLGTKNEVQTLIGYPFNTTNSNASATIDGKTYPMVTEGEAAWLASSADEPGFVAALKAGSKLVVRGTSQRGTNTEDTYDLGGVTAAMTEIDKACA